VSLIGRRVANLPPSNLHAQGYPTQACSIDPSLHSRGYSRATATTEQLNVRPPRPSVRNRAERKPDFIILGHDAAAAAAAAAALHSEPPHDGLVSMQQVLELVRQRPPVQGP